MGGYTGLRTYRSLGDHSPAVLGEAIYGVDMLAETWVYMPDGGTTIFKAEVSVSTKRPIGVVLYDGLTGGDAVVAFEGEIIIQAGGLHPGQVYYASPTTPGAMVRAKPSGAWQILGVAVTEYRFLITIQAFVQDDSGLPTYNSDQAAYTAGVYIYKTGLAHESLPYGVKKEIDPRIIPT